MLVCVGCGLVVVLGLLCELGLVVSGLCGNWYRFWY